jgi:uncharacterized protein (TIGR00156 family)
MMTKKWLTPSVLTGLAIVLFLPVSHAQFKGPGVSNIVSSVAQAKDANDNEHVVIDGFVINKIRDNKYTFRDSTGEITVEIDHDVFRGREVTPETKLQIKGEIDKDWNKTSIDVDAFEIMSQK